jgi:predicted dehydrogenase
MKRQEFLKSSIFASSLVIGRPFITFSKQSKFKIALIGSGWWGLNILREALKTNECELVAICDVDQNQLSKAIAEINKLTSDKPKKYTDFRELLAKEKVEIVINATPDHWHALIGIAAMQAGAHLFLEKPIGHTINEGKALLKAQADTQKICIVDFHRRYSAHNISANEFIKTGKLGKIKEVNAYVNYNYGKGSFPANPTSIPAGLDWDFWCGPAPLTTYNSDIHPRGFRQYMQFANGQLGDWGPHWFDQILWNMEETAPKKIFSTSKLSKIRESNWDSPENQKVIYEFEEFICTWQHTIVASHAEEKHQVGVHFVGTEGTLHVGWKDGWTFYPNNNAPLIHVDAKLNEPDQQNIEALFADFLASIKSKKTPLANLKVGHLATNMALLGVLAQKHGRSIEWDGKNEVILNDSEANKLLERQYRKPWDYPKF